MTLASTSALETLHPSLWRASQLARGMGEYVPCGFPLLSAELPGEGWPTGALIELFLSQPGSAELQLLQPALSSFSKGQIVLLQTPYQPQAMALSTLGIDLQRLVWLRCAKQNDALWAAEQILRNSSCAALLFWQSQVKTESLRRLHVAAQNGRTLFFVIRPEQFSSASSPAILRIQLQRIAQGMHLHFIKRRGVPKHESLFLPLATPPSMFSRAHSIDHQKSHVSISDNETTIVDRHSLTKAALRSISPTLVG